jgi:hypothetical protein
MSHGPSRDVIFGTYFRVQVRDMGPVEQANTKARSISNPFAGLYALQLQAQQQLNGHSTLLQTTPQIDRRPTDNVEIMTPAPRVAHCEAAIRVAKE